VIRKYERLCKLREVTAWPATLKSLSMWVQARAYGSAAEKVAKVQYSTIQADLSALKSVPIDRGEDTTVFASETLKRMVKGTAALWPKPKPRDRMKIDPTLLTKLVSPEATRGESETDRLNLNAAITTAFAGFLRMGEFTHTRAQLARQQDFERQRLTTRCVTPGANGRHLLLLLPTSKTDRNNEGVTIPLLRTGSAYCPVTHMEALLRSRPDSQGFRPLFELDNGGFPRAAVLAALKRRLYNVNIPMGSFRGHSFRRGAAQYAHDRGLSQPEIQCLGRWTSEAVERYFAKGTAAALRLQARLAFGTDLSYPEFNNTNNQ
jgi:hypothetical protein